MTIGFLTVAIPAAIKYPWMDKLCFAGILFMVINPVDVTFFSYTNYRGDIRGIEFGVTDWLAITMLAAMYNAPRWRKRKIYYSHSNAVFMWLYLLFCASSIITALFPQFAIFGVTKLIRAYFLFWITLNFIRDEKDLMFIVWTCVALTFYSFYQVLADKYIRGIFPPKASFAHQNTLATFQNICNYIVFAYLMQDTTKLFDKRTLIYWATVGAGSLTTLATLSRGGMFTMILGYLMIILLTFLLKQKSIKQVKKLKAIGLMTLMALPLLAFILPPIIKRFETAPEESANSRHDANISASEMGEDYFFGVGLNNYSYAINHMKYADRLGELDRGIAHHIFWLHYAELGVFGVVLFSLMTGGFMYFLAKFIAKRKDGLERVLAIGILIAFMINSLVGTLEWLWKQSQIMMFYFMLAGIAMSLCRVEKERDGLKRTVLRKYIILNQLSSSQVRR